MQAPCPRSSVPAGKQPGKKPGSPGLAGSGAIPRPTFPHPSAHRGARDATQSLIPQGPGWTGRIHQALAQRSRRILYANGCPQRLPGRVFPRDLRRGGRTTRRRVGMCPFRKAPRCTCSPKARCINRREDVVPPFPGHREPWHDAGSSGAAAAPQTAPTHPAEHLTDRLLGHKKHVACPTECAPQGGCITKPFTANKKPEDPTKCTVIAGFSSARLSDMRCDELGFRSPRQNQSCALPGTPPEHKQSCLNPTCSSPAPQEGGWWEEAAGGKPSRPGCCTSGGCRAQPTSITPLPALWGKRGRRASCKQGGCILTRSPLSHRGF